MDTGRIRKPDRYGGEITHTFCTSSCSEDLQMKACNSRMYYSYLFCVSGDNEITVTLIRAPFPVFSWSVPHSQEFLYNYQKVMVSVVKSQDVC